MKLKSVKSNIFLQNYLVISFKSWKNFRQATKDCCSKEMQQGNVEKFLCRLLNIEYGIYFCFVVKIVTCIMLGRYSTDVLG